MKCLTVGEIRELTKNVDPNMEFRVYDGGCAPQPVVQGVVANTNGKYGYVRSPGDRNRKFPVFVVVEEINSGEDTDTHLTESV